ncbi:hypothetical protein L484_024433 [Morus notabilis]|uniref:Uncharacterized protein n=1 Tax=Morus notabilis TaxID=981085 RepID=W9S7V4_9ROSA|nr:hypothetical protein L484_024433 [Morus notabilis]
MGPTGWMPEGGTYTPRDGLAVTDSEIAVFNPGGFNKGLLTVYRIGSLPLPRYSSGGGFWPGGTGAHRREAVARLGSRGVKPVCSND